ncbi:hypothetical protein HELRODRAFT_175375 [Helobdella robusta]|uniref:Apple domain-containing protein n=1 Tax=Helobdella robusta TaxID=6412 RepID=T1F975_HELRO|nr:hypothetical protein HELRODRAFT_175375 [Helobdella robusta]ESO00879.1 hypothetical protein HELRODRAFT_175375 [Helobdella robusta]
MIFCSLAASCCGFWCFCDGKIFERLEPHWIGVDLGNLFTIINVVLHPGKVSLKGSLIQNDLNFFIVGVSNRSLDGHPPVRGAYDMRFDGFQFNQYGNDIEPTNLALGAFTFNSSAHVLNFTVTFTSYFAVDGRKGWYCSMTRCDAMDHWIAVDLGNIFSILYTIVYASDSNPNDLQIRNNVSYFIVGVSNRSLDVHSPVRGTYDLCAQYPGVVAPKQVVQLNCSSTTPPARYVILQQPSNSSGVISICEWEIYGVPFGKFPVNLLLNKTVNISSIYNDFVCGVLKAALIVDGFHDTSLYNCHCGHNNDGSGGPNWYMVDMEASYFVDRIVLTARGDSPNITRIARRLDNFIIGLTDVDSSTSPPQRNNYPMCATWPGSVKIGSRVELKCNANLPKYRYLIAQASANTPDGFFAICELEAYEPLDENSFRWKRKSNVRLAGFQFKQLNVRSALECMHKCKQLGGCDSINFHPASKLCQFNSHVNGYYTTTLTSDTNWSFYTVNYS